METYLADEFGGCIDGMCMEAGWRVSWVAVGGGMGLGEAVAHWTRGNARGRGGDHGGVWVRLDVLRLF